MTAGATVADALPERLPEVPSDRPGGRPSGAPASRWRRVEWWYLLYLGILLFPPIFDPGTSTTDWVALAVVVALFLPTYLAAQLGSEATRTWCTVATAALAVVLFPFNTASTVLFVFAASFAGAFPSRARTLRWLAGLTLVLSAMLGYGAVAGDAPFGYVLVGFLTSAGFVWVIGLAVMSESHRDREAARLRVENARIEHLATVTERERIARDLHDLLGHTLTSVVVRAQLVPRLVHDDPDRAAREAAEIEHAAREALTQVRATVAGWRQTDLDDELRSAGGALAAAGVTLTVERPPDLRLAPSVETALALALREAATNVVRHADARRCTVTIGEGDGQLVLRVRDDGSGGSRPDGGGLTGMRERIAALGGSVDRVVRDGTCLTVRVPLEVAR